MIGAPRATSDPSYCKSRLIRIGEGRCPKCGKTHRRRVPGVLPRSACSNRLVAQTAAWHYVQGQTLGAVTRQFGLCKGTLIGQMHALAQRFIPVDALLVAAYRLAPVKHADETGWRNDGCNGSTWGFFTPHISIFRCRDTRSGDVAAEVLGPPEMHVGTLHVDRYAVQHIQSLFREKAHRMYHWTRGRHIPADNNRAERELRPLVIARKISFGSQSDKGLRTREILMAEDSQSRFGMNRFARAVARTPSS